jgi:hypothetical protein
MTDIFSDPQKTEEGSKSPQSTNAADHLSGLVGEGKKFKTVDDLARGKIEADNYIQQLTNEQKELRQAYAELESQLKAGQTVEDVLRKMQGSRGSEDGNQPGSTIAPEDILKLVDDRLSKSRQDETRRANEAESQAAILKHFNNNEQKAREFVQQEARRLGMDPKALKEIGASSPAAFTRLLGLSQSRATGPNIQSEVNSDAQNDGYGGVRNEAYYRDLRTKLGPKFWEPNIQQQRMRDRQSLGERYYK